MLARSFLPIRDRSLADRPGASRRNGRRRSDDAPARQAARLAHLALGGRAFLGHHAFHEHALGARPAALNALLRWAMPGGAASAIMVAEPSEQRAARQAEIDAPGPILVMRLLDCRRDRDALLARRRLAASRGCAAFLSRYRAPDPCAGAAVRGLGHEQHLRLGQPARAQQAGQAQQQTARQ
jgi:hypothetical protein